jgi:hypothetical protein
MAQKCYACGRKFRKNSHGMTPFHPEALTEDGQRQPVGLDCSRRIVDSGQAGYQPPAGGPRLWSETYAPAHVLKNAGITRYPEASK